MSSDVTSDLGPPSPEPSDGADGPVTTVPLGDVAPTPVSSPKFGDRIGRFEILESIGEGGVGRVYCAYDPELDRRVAVKLLHRFSDPTTQARFLREAQIMARLNHPNILPVFDVGSDVHGPFIAMELVEGSTLRHWLRRRRPWSEVVRTFAVAGRALLCAHETGLIHRDFKPANVMIGHDGRVRVMDFGLARAVTREDSLETRPVLEIGDGFLDQTLTEPHLAMGSPPYMAPEQHRGERLDPRCDQYSFCVSLWEGLYGARPYVGSSPSTLFVLKMAHQPVAPRQPGSQRALHEALMRGLSPAPADRFPSMVELLEVLDRAVIGRRRRKWLMAGLVPVLMTGAAAMVPHREVAEPQCDGAWAKLEGAWDPATRAELRASSEAADPQAWAELEPLLEAYAKQWADAHTDTCAATRLRHEQLETAMDARMWCLDDRLRHLSALVDTVKANPEAVAKGVRAAGQLPSIGQCADLQHVERQGTPPSDARVRLRVELLQDELAGAMALYRIGEYEEGLTVAKRVDAGAQALGYEPLEAETAMMVGRLERQAGRFDEATQSLSRAYFAASRWNLDIIAANAATSLCVVTGSERGDFEAGMKWAKHAEAAALHLEDDVLRATIAMCEGAVYGRGRDHERALAAFELVVELYSRARGPRHPSVAMALHNVGGSQIALGRLELALGSLGRALEILEENHPGDHPDIAMTLGTMGGAYLELGELERARESSARALAMFEALMGPEHPYLIEPAFNLAEVEQRQGRHAEALAGCRRAQALMTGAYGPEHLLLVHPQLCIAKASMALGDPSTAATALEHALALPDAEGWPAEQQGKVRFLLAQALTQEPRDPGRARALAEEALEHYRHVQGDEAEKITEIEAWLRRHRGTPARRRRG